MRALFCSASRRRSVHYGQYRFRWSLCVAQWGNRPAGYSKRLSSKAAASEVRRRTLWGARCDKEGASRLCVPSAGEAAGSPLRIRRRENAGWGQALLGAPGLGRRDERIFWYPARARDRGSRGWRGRSICRVLCREFVQPSMCRVPARFLHRELRPCEVGEPAVCGFGLHSWLLRCRPQ